MKISGALLHSVMTVMSNPSLKSKLMTVSELFFNKAISGRNVEE